jgi:hypothetical protein
MRANLGSIYITVELLPGLAQATCSATERTGAQPTIGRSALILVVKMCASSLLGRVGGEIWEPS